MVDRPDPDTLLARVEREAARAKRGRLKIFFGAAAGVGKTFAMLEAARERRAEGIDVVVGLVETHGRKETDALLEGLKILPTQAIEYRGTTLREFDLDGALKRRPGLLLVDELAHTNAPGSRHAKRWQDVEELLDAGIHIYTTLNVQHLESLNDDVGQIAGIRVWETVPDTVFEEADDIELVDLPPDELLLRLKEGKVYVPEQAHHAARNFFRKGNLIALRELALRHTASQVDAQMRGYREDHAIREVWQVGERILVCIGPGPLAERLIRAGKRFAMGLRADWIVAYVETPELQRLSAERRDAVLRMLRLAEQLGAEAVTLNAAEMSTAILDFARERNITKIVMGKPTRRGWKRWLLGSVVDTLISQAHNINLYLLGSPDGGRNGTGDDELALFRKTPPPGLQEPSEQRRQDRYWRYALAVGVVGACTLVARLLFGGFDLANLVMVYLVGVIFVATRFGQGPSILASVLAVAAFDFLFVTPYYSFSVSDTQYFITLLGMLSVAMVISHLMANVRYQARVASHRERRATVLYRMSRELSAARSESDIVRIAVRHVHAEFGSRNVILFPNEHGRVVYPKEKPLEASLRGADLGVAQWVYDHNEMAGQGTHTLAGANAAYFPLGAEDQAIGVLSMLPANLRRIFLPEQRQLLETFLSQIAHALERVRLAEQARTVAVEMEAERLRNSLLSSISHDLRTPLATIVGSASTLAEQDETLNPADRRNLSRAIFEEAERMSNLIANILDMARLDAGAVQLNRQWQVLEEIIGTVLNRLERRLKGRMVSVRLPRDLPLLYVDGVMIEQVLANLIENAAKYSPSGTPIEITAEGSAFAVTVSVADRGPGIPGGQEEKLFEKFSRVHPESAQSGVGLGLAICKAIVEAHGGWIRAKNRGTGGALFTFMLPLEQAQPGLVPEPEEAA
jgi:two-component system sensor histidine kinase KdpD